MTNLTLSVLPDLLAVCHLDASSSLPGWALSGDFYAITRTIDELSIVCREVDVPPGVRYSGRWRALKVHGPLDFSLTGVLAGLSAVLAGANVSIFALSTYDTDYVLVQSAELDRAVSALRLAGYTV